MWQSTGPTRTHVSTQVDGTVPEVTSSVVVLEDSPSQTTMVANNTVATQTDSARSSVTTAMETVEKASRITKAMQTEQRGHQVLEEVHQVGEYNKCSFSSTQPWEFGLLVLTFQLLSAAIFKTVDH